MHSCKCVACVHLLQASVACVHSFILFIVCVNALRMCVRLVRSFVRVPVVCVFVACIREFACVVLTFTAVL